MPIGNRDGYHTSIFDSKAVDDTYTALDSNTAVAAFILRNLTGKDILIRVGSSGDAITVKDGFESPSLKGNPSGYQIKNNTDTDSVTVELILYYG